MGESFHNVYVYQIIMMYTLNILQCYLSITPVSYYIPLSSQRRPVYLKRGYEARWTFGLKEFSLWSPRPPELFLDPPLELPKPETGYLFFFFFWACHTACGILVPQPGIESGPQQ